MTVTMTNVDISLWETLKNLVNMRKDVEIFRVDEDESEPNAITLAAAKEARDIMSGKISAKRYDSVDDLLSDALAEDVGQTAVLL